jgi:hypothetical protein
MHIPKNKSKKERSIKQIPCRGDETLATTTPSPHKKKQKHSNFYQIQHQTSKEVLQK